MTLGLITSLLNFTPQQPARPTPQQPGRPTPQYPGRPGHSTGSAPGSFETHLSSAKQSPLANTSWKITGVNGHPVAPLQINGKFPTLSFGPKGSVTFKAVNTNNGTYSTKDGNFSFKPGASTRMAGPPRDMRTEQRIAKALQSATQWRLGRDDGSLALLSNNGVVLTARKQ